MNGNGRLTVQEMAEQSGVSAHTLRYYERIGLLQPVARTPSGHRRYAADDLGWVRLLVCLRETGMGIRDMLRFVAVDGGELSVAERRLALLEAHRDAVRARQQEVEAHLEVIEGKLAHYRATLREAEPLGEIGDKGVMRANRSASASRGGRQDNGAPRSVREG